jgi:hypothetical protein
MGVVTMVGAAIVGATIMGAAIVGAAITGVIGDGGMANITTTIK